MGMEWPKHLTGKKPLKATLNLPQTAFAMKGKPAAE